MSKADLHKTGEFQISRTQQLNATFFSHLTNLMVINLLQSRVSTLKNAPFRRQQKLKQLIIAENIIPVIYQHSFKGLWSIDVLDLHGAAIEQLQKNCFYDLRSLKVLNISNNLLESLNGDVFHGLALLNKLDLSNNAIMSITNDTFANLHFTIYVSDCNLCCFAYNPASCNIRDSSLGMSCYNKSSGAVHRTCNNVLPNDTTSLLCLSLLITYLLCCTALNVYFQWKSPVWNDQTCVYLFFSFNDILIILQCVFIVSAHLFYGDSYPLVRSHIGKNFLCISYGLIILVTQIFPKICFLCLALIYQRITIHAMVKQPYTVKMICLAVILSISLLFGLAVALDIQINKFRPPFCYPYQHGKYMISILQVR